MPEPEKKTGSPGSPPASTYSNEKGRTSEVERVSAQDGDGAPVHEIYNPHVDVSGIDEKKLIRKLDWYLVPWLSLLYLLSFLDRTSIGNAKLYHMETDLHITDKQYLIALTIFFFSYAIFEVPSNVFLKRLRPSIWLSLLMFCWGIMMTVQGLVHNYGGLLGMRWLLGMFEAGLFPGVNYYLSCWYKRSEFGIRAALFFSAATVSGAFGGLLAAAISKLDGVGGKPAWAWIFIIEGLATVVAGALSFSIIQDFPDTAKFLTEAERTFIVRRLQSDDQFSAAGESLNQLGYRATAANLLSVPVYAVACVVTCVVALAADRYGNRGYLTMLSFSVGLAGYLILIVSRNATLSYIAVYLAACGIYPTIPNIIAWVSNNVEGSYKRSVTLAMVISFGNINGAVSSNVYRAHDAPWYRLGHGIVLMYIGIGLVMAIVYHLALRRENAKRERGERDEIIEGVNDGQTELAKNGRYKSVADAKRNKGDEWSGALRVPAVRVEPEPQHPTVEKWTYWNAFDPDSDEFFDNDDAVYEAFIDPADRIQLPADPTEPPAEAIDVSSSSEASSSGRGTPMEVVDDIDTQTNRMMTVTMQDLESRTRIMRALDLPLPRNSALDAAIDVGRGLPAEERVTYLRSLLDRTDSDRERAQEPRAQAEARSALREREPTYLDWPQEDSRPTTPEPAGGARASVPVTPVRPSTPPAQAAQATPLFISPSPPPSVTPRLYSWATISASGPAVPTSPLTNRGARMSVAHIVRPSLVPVHRAA
ncbi:major facilitator superfamily domain-containing protein [Ganoderma leucocontextum]|nr:major facilitator superfamily domain-containing protein [Ganoderma leucocontextum]